MFTRTPTVMMTACCSSSWLHLVANDAGATNGRTGEFIALTYNDDNRRWN